MAVRAREQLTGKHLSGGGREAEACEDIIRFVALHNCEARTKGIFEYVLGGEQDRKLLNVRVIFAWPLCWYAPKIKNAAEILFPAAFFIAWNM